MSSLKNISEFNFNFEYLIDVLVLMFYHVFNYNLLLDCIKQKIY